MSISITRYIDIISGVGGGVAVGKRSFGLRLFTSNATLPVNTLVEFTTLADVGTYFTTASEEYKRASFYFGWVSKSIKVAHKISFYGWDSLNDTLTAMLDKSLQTSNDFGSFAFMDNLALTITQVEEIATWNNAQNVMFMYCQSVTAANASAWSATLLGYAGLALELTTLATDEYPELMPAVVFAATDYTEINGTQNYMFQMFPTLTPTVTDNVDASAYDALRINYLGQTQTAGQKLSFFQRGDLMGGSTSPIAMNIYANEAWLKDAVGAELMSLLLSLPKVSANNLGVAQILTIVQSVINNALINGTISIGKTLDTVQQLYITNQTGDNKAWHKVQSIGYWVSCKIESYVTNGITEYKAVYTLIYAKDDTIRAVNGSHILI